MALQTERIQIYGRSGSGKTTLSRQLIQPYARVIAFDPLAEYARPENKQKYGFKVVYKLWGKGGVQEALLANPHAFKIAYVPPVGKEPESLSILSNLIKAFQAGYHQHGRDVLLVVDELNLGFPVASLPRNIAGFGELCSRGRHWGVAIIGISQRPAEVNTRWRGNCNVSIFFALTFAGDQSVAAQMLGAKHKAAIATLPPYYYLMVDMAGKVTRSRTVA